MASVEEAVEDYFKQELDRLGIIRYCKVGDDIPAAIRSALEKSESKSGGVGRNYPDIQCLLDNGYGRRIPVMMEAKGTKGVLELLDKGVIRGVIPYDKDTGNHKKGEPNYSYIQKGAVNGALHYGKAILNYSGEFDEVIIIGLNGYKEQGYNTGWVRECKAYYVAKKNHNEPKHIKELDDDLTLLAPRNIQKLYSILDTISLTEEERENLKRKMEVDLEEKVNTIHDRIYHNLPIRLDTNDKLYLFCGLIMAGLPTEGVAPLTAQRFTGNDDGEDNDGTVILNRIKSFLKKKSGSTEKIDMVYDLLKGVFTHRPLWKPDAGGVSILKSLFLEINENIIPCLTSDLHLDFTGKIFNSLSSWVSIGNDPHNNVVLTPRYVTTFMARLARTNRDSIVWDTAMGSGGFLISAMDIMIRDAKEHFKDSDELEEKIRKIKEEQLLGIEVLPNIYMLAVLNMILMGDGSSSIFQADSLKEEGEYHYKNSTPATVFLLNPPYSANGQGLIFVEKALSYMKNGYAAILIQENAGEGQGGEYTKRILKGNTLIASIRMPKELFKGKAEVKTAIYVFQIGQPHPKQYEVKFIDFSNDGYKRNARKKSKKNLQDEKQQAAERYDEVVDRVIGNQPQTGYYTEENGLFIRDTISLEGNDWTFEQHKIKDSTPTEADFKKNVADFIAWKINSQFSRKMTITNESFENKKIDTSSWSNFRLDQLFNIELSKSINLNQIKFDAAGKYDFIGRSSVNYGIQGHVNHLGYEPNEANTFSLVQVGKSCCCFREAPWYASQNMFILKPNYGEMIDAHLFLSCVLNKYLEMYEEGYKYPTLAKLKRVSIKLPALSNEMPNWSYMQEYIVKLEQERIVRLKLYMAEYCEAAKKLNCAIHI